MASADAKKTVPQMNKKARAKLAKDTINTLIPHILKTNERARTGVINSQLIRYDPSLTPKRAPSARVAPPVPPSAQESAPETSQSDTPRQATRPKIRVIKSDTLDAAHSILVSNPKPAKKARIAVLNMASPLRPGGGVLNGAIAQEESLCIRSTLYASLREEWYRLPEDSVAHSPDVLVFRASAHACSSPSASSPSPSPSPRGASEVAKKEDWWYVDVISCAALRFPETRQRQGKDGALERGYADEAQREAMARRVRTILQVAAQKGVTHLVLGALGCGAYGNPPAEVAEIFRRVICGDRKGRRIGVTVEESGIEEVLFAIFDEGENLRTFTEVFADVSVGDEG